MVTFRKICLNVCPGGVAAVNWIASWGPAASGVASRETRLDTKGGGPRAAKTRDPGRALRVLSSSAPRGLHPAPCPTSARPPSSALGSDTQTGLLSPGPVTTLRASLLMGSVTKWSLTVPPVLSLTFTYGCESFCTRD